MNTFVLIKMSGNWFLNTCVSGSVRANPNPMLPNSFSYTETSSVILQDVDDVGPSSDATLSWNRNSCDQMEKKKESEKRTE